jgi:Tol biopolymer transport system component
MHRHTRWSLVLAAACGGGTDPTPAGELAVTVTATGVELPPELDLDIDASLYHQVVGAASPSTYSLPAGSHTITLHAASNCRIGGAAQETRQVIVKADSTVTADFAMTCVSHLARLSIVAAVSGPDPTPYLFIPTVTNLTYLPPPVLRDSTLVLDLAPGSYTVDLAEVPANCTFTTAHPRNLLLAMGDAVTTRFDLTCTRPTGLGVAVTLLNRGVAVMPATGGVGLLAQGEEPDWSPDGTRVVFLVHDSLKTIAPDGTGLTKLAALPAATLPGRQPGRSHPGWSPDGSQIAMIGLNGTGQDVFVVGANGGVPHALTADGAPKSGLRWSPDGQHLAYASGGDIYFLAADGSSTRSVTTGRYAHADLPAWSPDGARLAFESDQAGQFDVYVIDTAGTTVNLLTPGPVTGMAPAWSASGRIAYESDNGTVPGIEVVDEDGSNPVFLAGVGYRPALSADGSHLAVLVPHFSAYPNPTLLSYPAILDAGTGNGVFLDLPATGSLSFGSFP